MLLCNTCLHRGLNQEMLTLVSVLKAWSVLVYSKKKIFLEEHSYWVQIQSGLGCLLEGGNKVEPCILKPLQHHIAAPQCHFCHQAVENTMTSGCVELQRERLLHGCFHVLSWIHYPEFKQVERSHLPPTVSLELGNKPDVSCR